MITPPSQLPTATDFVSIRNLITGGDITNASKAELERYAVILASPSGHSTFGERQYQQVCETVRTLLMVRMSEEANKEATRISKIALLVAMVALGCSIIQVFSPFFFAAAR